MPAKKSTWKSSVQWTMLLYVENRVEDRMFKLAAQSFVLPGQPTERDLAQSPVQQLRFNDGINTIDVLIYATGKVSESFIGEYVGLWKRGLWHKIDLKKPRKTARV